MAPPAGQIRPGRYLAFFVLIVVGLYALVFFTGGGQPTPKLGIDLQGGTRVTLTARTPDGSDPSRAQLQQARQIIEKRVNGIGVSGAEVLLDGSNVVITVPGDEGEQAKTLGQTAKLGFRQVIAAQPTGAVPPQGEDEQEDTNESGGDGDPALMQDQIAEEIQQAKEVRQDPDLVPTGPGGEEEMIAVQEAQQEALAGLDCTSDHTDPLAGNDDPDLPLVTCNQEGTEKYVLSPVFLQGTEIDDASAVFNSERGQWVVNLSFNREGGDIWADFTAANINQRAAFVLDTEVVSAPNITEAIPGGNTQITGQFNQTEAQNLADVLKYGSLPLSFSSSDATTVSATLGLASLKTGLIAGAVGLAFVFLYCLFYYRVLGVLTILSLVLSATIVYAVLVLLGRWIGFTLDLAGVAGFIVAIGVTADSFVVYFERIKDEMREGRTFRSAVPRGWVKARRTILASDAIMFLAAIVLYVLAVGEVKGFAFTLGLSTALDLIVVFLVTHPLVVLVARSKMLSSPQLSGLGAVQQIGAARRSATRVGAAAKEA